MLQKDGKRLYFSLCENEIDVLVGRRSISSFSFLNPYFLYITRIQSIPFPAKISNKKDLLLKLSRTQSRGNPHARIQNNALKS